MNDRRVFESTFMRSPAIPQFPNARILVKEGYPSATKAYNDGIDEAKGDLLIFAHQDIFLPETWPAGLSRALDFLFQKGEKWGVLGCYGRTAEDIGWGYLYSTGLARFVGGPFGNPRPVQTLDEVILIFRKSSGLRFDDQLPHFHFYGADICLAAHRAGMRNYAIDAFCIHNSNQVVQFTKEFYEGYRYIRNKNEDLLPVQTSCIRISKHNSQYYRHKAIQWLGRLRRERAANIRSDDVGMLWEKVREKLAIK